MSSTTTTNPNRYSERVTSYTLNGAIRRLQRHGLKDNGVYGKIDNLNITLEGNRVVAVTDNAAPLLRAGSTDFADGSDTTAEYTYNGVGALTSDANRGITLIEYDNQTHPRRVSFRDGHTVEWVYAPDGTRLRAIHTTAVEGVSVAPGMRAEPDAAHIVRRDTTDYSAGVTWGPDNRLERVEIPGGYATIGAGGVPEYHYYTADHVGNNRVVVSEDGVIEQVVHYYPFGGQYADAGLNLSAQQYKHGGKELDPAYGLDWHDFGARPYYAPLAAWLHPDALAGDYIWLSPYCYCANNPVNIIDPDGNNTYSVDSIGHISLIEENNNPFDYLISNAKGGEASIKADKSFMASQTEQSVIYGRMSANITNSGVVNTYSSTDDISDIYNFLVENTVVEWSYMSMIDADNNPIYYIGTTHDSEADASQHILLNNAIKEQKEILIAVHCHDSGSVVISDGDIGIATAIQEHSPNAKNMIVFRNSDRPPLYFDKSSIARQLPEVNVEFKTTKHIKR